jgi:hypothetical protein
VSAANLSTGSNVAAEEDVAKAANLSAGSNAAHGPPGLAAPYHAQIEAGLRQGLTAQRIWQDLCVEVAYPLLISGQFLVERGSSGRSVVWVAR